MTEQNEGKQFRQAMNFIRFIFTININILLPLRAVAVKVNERIEAEFRWTEFERNNIAHLHSFPFNIFIDTFIVTYFMQLMNRVFLSIRH